MGNQEEWALDASRQFSLASETALDVDDTFSSGSRKRKRGGGAMDELLDDSIVVKSHPSTLSTKPRTLRPIALLHRSHLPLTCINTNSSSNPLPDSQLFESHVKVLELEERMGSRPMLVIARLDDGKSLYAVERESRGLYALCRLGSWVNLEKLISEAVVSRHQRRVADRESLTQVPHNQDNVEQTDVTPESSKYSKKKRLAIEAIQSMMKRPTAETSANSQVLIQSKKSAASTLELQVQEVLSEEVGPDELMSQPAETEILENILSHYLEALYLSKTSLGYFAKGPLSRARAAFHLDYDSTLDMNDLISFLDSLILPTTILDKKYKDGLAEVVSKFSIGEGSADEAEKAKPDSKRRKSKKMKLGKSGLYLSEDKYLRKWWAACDADTEPGITGLSKDDIARRRVAQLRIRETQLQIIVILETLALRPLANSQTGLGGELPLDSLREQPTDAKPGPTSKPKKARDLPGLIEIHVDRLCIWQSLAAEEGRSASKPSGTVDSGGDPSDFVTANTYAPDVLREFCVEVIVPFFSARLPEVCSTISRKLGGPANSSPSARPKLVKSASVSGALSRPGAVTKRPGPLKARRSLQRVLTDERHSWSGSRGPSAAISLMRSATAPVVVSLKRETSETPSLSSIPTVGSQKLHVSRGGVIKSKKFSQREVDLSIVVNANDAKVKKANIEAELREAITALKRPNRQLAGQTQVDRAEKRVATASSHSRKSKKPIRNPFFQGVQVMATPKMNRRKDVEHDSLPMLSADLERDSEAQAIPASSLPRVPQSVARFARSPRSSSVCKKTPAPPQSDRAIASAIQGTPCRSSTQSRVSSSLDARNFEAYDGVTPSSPLVAKRQSKLQLLSVPDSRTEGILNYHQPAGYGRFEATRTKRNMFNIENEDPSQTVISTPVSVGMKNDAAERLLRVESGSGNDNSIYTSLGWDDYDDF